MHSIWLLHSVYTNTKYVFFKLNLLWHFWNNSFSNYLVFKWNEATNRFTLFPINGYTVSWKYRKIWHHIVVIKYSHWQKPMSILFYLRKNSQWNSSHTENTCPHNDLKHNRFAISDSEKDYFRFAISKAFLQLLNYSSTCCTSLKFYLFSCQFERGKTCWLPIFVYNPESISFRCIWNIRKRSKIENK